MSPVLRGIKPSQNPLRGIKIPEDCHTQVRQLLPDPSDPEIYTCLCKTQTGGPALNVFEILCEFQMKNQSAFKTKWKWVGACAFPLGSKEKLISLLICIFLLQMKVEITREKHPIKTKA